MLLLQENACLLKKWISRAKKYYQSNDYAVTIRLDGLFNLMAIKIDPFEIVLVHVVTTKDRLQEMEKENLPPGYRREAVKYSEDKRGIVPVNRIVYPFKKSDSSANFKFSGRVDLAL